jgi:drug/metabolite transporter (DMT)-like permease
MGNTIPFCRFCLVTKLDNSLMGSLFMFLISHNKTTNSAKIGLALGFSGMIILVGPSIRGQGLSLTGVASLLISSMLWG